MSKLYDFQELVNESKLPERTVRYYLAKVLNAPGGTRGRKAFYSQETLDQLKLAKQVLMQPYDPKRGEIKPSLKNFRRWLDDLSAEEISKMVEMPYRVKPRFSLTTSGSYAKAYVAEEQAEMLSVDEPSQHRSAGGEDKEKTKDSAARYLNKVMGHQPRERGRDQHWNRIRFGDDLEIRTRKRLTQAQKRQLRLAGELLRSMLEEKQE
jgi:hypothetical protein